MITSGADPELYLAVLSRQTGVITLFKDGKILYSAIPEEIHPTFKQYLQPARDAAKPYVSLPKAA